jgi:hypothetical protein
VCGGAHLITRRVRKVAGARKCREAIHGESLKFVQRYINRNTAAGQSYNQD